MSEYTYHVRMTSGFDKAISQVTNALADEGFGVLSDIDVSATLKKKIDVPFHAYRILGACNPELAYQALQLDDTAGALLPCNVVVQEAGKGVSVDIAKPEAMVRATDSRALESVMHDADQRLKRVAEHLSRLE